MTHYPFAVFTHHLVSVSETFIKRHIEELLPGRTAVVAEVSESSGKYARRVMPILVLEEIEPPRLRYRILHAACRKLGWRGDLFGEEMLVKRFCRDHHVKVALGEFLNNAVRWFPLTRELGIRLYAHAHGYDVSALLRDPDWRRKYLLLNEAAGIITMSHASRQRLIDLGLDPGKISVVPYGVDVPAHFAPRRDENSIRCLATGRMTGKKAPIMLLDAFRRAMDACPRLTLDWVGDGPLMTAAIQFVRAFGLEDRVNFHGSRPNEFVKGLMNRAHIFVQHSIVDPVTGDEEGLPVAILEAMASGLPVVSTRHAGIPEAVIDGVTGYLVDEGDTAAMADRIVELAGNSALRRNLGEAGWSRAKDEFSWDRERSRLLSIMGLPAK